MKKEKITELVSEIVEKYSPLQIFMISKKTDKNGDITTFKICAILKDEYENRAEIEGKILVNSDVEIPFDVIIYNISDWNELLLDDCSFAYRIDNEGEVLYEQK